MSLTGKLLAKYDAIDTEEKKVLKELLQETESFNFKNLTEFTQDMTLAIVSSAKDKLL